MSNRAFQGIIHQMKDVVDRTIGVIDENGIIISCSEFVKIGESRQSVCNELAYTPGIIRQDGVTYRALGTAGQDAYVVFVEGEDEKAEELAQILSISLGQIKSLYDEKHDKGSFIKNIIMDNILPSDIYIKSKELHFAPDVMRVVLLIKFLGQTEAIPYEVIQSMFPDKNRDYVIIINESDVVLVKEVEANTELKEVEQIAQQIADTVSTELYVQVAIGIGTMVNTLKDLARSYKEAQVSLEVGKVFDTEKQIVSYDNLGIGRLIYQLPITLCEMFLSEVFKKGSLDALDQETLMTIQCFFENNLNVSETSRKLFVHRNTLVYRLEKIRKLTGLDLREFEHAITFKVALMVKKYLSSKPTKF